jgi:hypothetical protein
MNQPLFLYMMLLGCRPEGRLIEQHDMFFGIGSSMKDLVPHIKNSWPETRGIMHVDAWRKVSQVNGYSIRVVERNMPLPPQPHLFFINLGGYSRGEFDEFHLRMLVVAHNKSEAILQSKKTSFYQLMGYKGAESHVDDKYGVDVDEVYEIKDILPHHWKSTYQLEITENPGPEDEMNLGYFKLDKL